MRYSELVEPGFLRRKAFYFKRLPGVWHLAPTILLAACGDAVAEIDKTIDPDTGLTNWRLVAEGVELELNPRLPAGIRAFFEARGFPVDATHDIADRCVMWTIARNTAPADSATALAIRLQDWRVESKEYSGAPLDKGELLESWLGKGIGESARLAFRWATFPSRQTLLPGDHIWGMTLLGAPPGATADVRIAWRFNDTFYSETLRGVECGKDQ